MKEIIISKKSRFRGDDGHKVISLRIKQETLDKIEEMSSKTERSRNEIINTLLSAAVDNVIIKD